jgi:hypothetical protein
MKAALGGIVLVIRVPMDVFIVIMVGIFVVGAVLWGIVGILNLLDRRRTRKRLELIQKESAQSFKASLPRQIGPTVTMTEVAADGMALTLTFIIDIDKATAEMRPDFLELLKKRLAPATLNRDAALKNLKAGLIYRYRFIDRDAKVMGLLNLTDSDFV